MSTTTCRLRDRFEHVCRAELDRLHRKTAALAPGVRDDVHAMSLEVARGIANQIESALSRHRDSDLREIVQRLFGVRNIQQRAEFPATREAIFYDIQQTDM